MPDRQSRNSRWGRYQHTTQRRAPRGEAHLRVASSLGRVSTTGNQTRQAANPEMSNMSGFASNSGRNEPHAGLVKLSVYCIHRGGDKYSPMVAIDELPTWLKIIGLHRSLSEQEVAENRYQPLGNSEAPNQYSFEYDHTAMNEELGIPSVNSSVPSRNALWERLNASMPPNSNTSPIDPRTGRQKPSSQRYTPITPGILGHKLFCTHWMRTGECDFMQQGCLFLHVMPDLNTLEEIGYRSYPRWFREMPQEFRENNSCGLADAALLFQNMNGWESLPRGMQPRNTGFHSTDSTGPVHPNHAQFAPAETLNVPGPSAQPTQNEHPAWQPQPTNGRGFAARGPPNAYSSGTSTPNHSATNVGHSKLRHNSPLINFQNGPGFQNASPNDYYGAPARGRPGLGFGQERHSPNIGNPSFGPPARVLAHSRPDLGYGQERHSANIGNPTFGPPARGPVHGRPSLGYVKEHQAPTSANPPLDLSESNRGDSGMVNKNNHTLRGLTASPKYHHPKRFTSPQFQNNSRTSEKNGDTANGSRTQDHKRERTSSEVPRIADYKYETSPASGYDDDNRDPKRIRNAHAYDREAQQSPNPVASAQEGVPMDVDNAPEPGEITEQCEEPLIDFDA